jgi:hypothetical protein
MGEWSKKIGEKGEDVASYFLKEYAGFPTPQKGVSLSCNFPDKHERTENTPRTTHGIDLLISYKCPLVNNLLEIGIISVKYTADKYPSNPRTIFKKHFEDLAYTLECFKNSQKRNDINNNYSGITDTSDTGILFFLSNHDEDYNKDIIGDISKSLFTGKDYDYEKIIVVDNSRLSFLYDAISYVSFKYGKNNYSFLYPDTGLNNSPINSINSDKRLPLQYFSASVLPIRIVDKEEIILYLALKDEFCEDHLKRMVGLAQKLNNLSNKTIIAFPNYNELVHSEIVQSVLSLFEDSSFISKVNIISYNEDFRNTSN